ncbi:hypothetical protein TWF281_006148 [Arthrobotrys megalospora]
MRLHPYLLILLYAANKCRALDDDSDWSKNKCMTKLMASDPNARHIVDINYSWEGVIKSMFANEKNTCLTIDVLGRGDENPTAGIPVGIFKCPDDLEKAQLHQKWFIKGKMEGTHDVEPTFKGYIRSSKPTKDGEYLCLTARKDPSRTPLSIYREGHAKYGRWTEQNDCYDWNNKQGAKKHDNFWNHHMFFTSWGVVYMDRCRDDWPPQQWLIGLSLDLKDGKRRYKDDPSKWNWIRPLEMDSDECEQPVRDVNKNDVWGAWCETSKECPPNYPYHPGLMRPWMNPDKIDDRKKVQWVMVGCSPSNWMPQPNFGLLDKNAEIRADIVRQTINDPRIAPVYLDPDLQPIQMA